jgi:hypothetical protein
MLSWSMRFLVVGRGGGGFLDRNYAELASKVSPSGISRARDLRVKFADQVPANPEFEAAFQSTASRIRRSLAMFAARWKHINGGIILIHP